MKTEKQVRAKLLSAQKELRAAKKRFEEDDNHEDMEDIARISQCVADLIWVLEASCSS